MNSRLVKSVLANTHLIKLSFSFNAVVKVTSNYRFLHSSRCKHQAKASAMSKPTVYVTRKLDPSASVALSEFCQVTSWPGSDPVPRYELLQNIQNKDALLCMLTDKIDAEILGKANKLKVVATMSVGYDHLDVAELKKRGIKIGYTPGVLTHATAEFTVGLLLATSRRILEANSEARRGGWQTWSPYWMTGPGLEGSVVGIVGFGRIGQEVAKRLKPFRVQKITYFSRTQKKDAEAEIGVVRATFGEILTESDFIIVCLALNPETVRLFNEEAFKKMKKTAVFVNTSRGGVVDQDALVKALQKGQIWGAGLDVMTPEPLPLDHPLFMMKNCVILPHIASASIQTRTAMAMLSVRNVIAALEGKKMPSELVPK